MNEASWLKVNVPHTMHELADARIHILLSQFTAYTLIPRFNGLKEGSIGPIMPIVR